MAAAAAGPGAGPVPGAPPPAGGGPITIQDLIQRTGRENGPDIMLKLDDAIKVPIAGGVITPTSNITEVLNVIAYLCNNTRDNNSIELNSSIDINQSGLHNADDGLYTVLNTGDGPSGGSLWLDDTAAGPTPPMINLDTLQALVYPANHIPVGILTRTGAPVGGTELKGTNNGTNNALAAAAAAGAIPAADALPNFVNCIKQLINIAESTRTIFGPKGWTALFNQVKGGGGSSRSKNAKRTHRRHRRRYSSKQY
jgi:hypothetical protein